jgi:hypothetical protein
VTVARTPARRESPTPLAPREGFAGFGLSGKDPVKWAEFRQSLLVQVQVLFEGLARDQPGSGWLKEQAKEFGALALDCAKAHLRKPGLDAAKVEAEVAKLYAEREKALAEARKAHADARSKELDNTIRELRLCLGFTKAMLVGEQGDEVILLGMQLDAMIEAVKALAEPSGG